MSHQGVARGGIVPAMDRVLRTLPYLWVWGMLLVYPLWYIDPVLAKIGMGIVMLSVGSIFVLSILGIDTTDE